MSLVIVPSAVLGLLKHVHPCTMPIFSSILSRRSAATCVVSVSAEFVVHNTFTRSTPQSWICCCTQRSSTSRCRIFLNPRLRAIFNCCACFAVDADRDVESQIFGNALHAKAGGDPFDISCNKLSPLLRHNVDCVTEQCFTQWPLYMIIAPLVLRRV